MKLLFILIFILLNTTNIFAQLQGQALIDSLLKELPKMKEDTNAVNLLDDLSFSRFSHQNIKSKVKIIKLLN